MSLVKKVKKIAHEIFKVKPVSQPKRQIISILKDSNEAKQRTRKKMYKKLG